MKKIFCILILIAAIGICGCSQGDTDSPAGSAAAQATGLSESLPVQMGCIRISAGELPGDEYIPAEVCASWGDREMAASAEIKLRGNSSKESEKKAYTVKFEEDTELLGMDSGRKWALVSNPFDKSLLRPVVGFSYAEALGIEYTSQVRLCKVWLNDRYMGVYTAMEPVEAGKGRVEIDPDDGDFLLERNTDRYEENVVYMESPVGMRFEFNEPEEPDESQVKQCYEMLGAAENAIFSKDHTVYEKYIDVDSFVNFYIFHELVKDVDFGEYSTRYYFKDGILHAGPPWDLDLTMGNVSAEKEEYKYGAYNNADGCGDESGDSTRGMWAEGTDYYYWLCRDPWFNERLQQRWQAVRSLTENLAADNELGRSLLGTYTDVYGETLEANFSAAGWSVSVPEKTAEWQEPADTYAGNVEMLRVWLIKRVAYLDAQLNSENFVNFR